MANDTIIDYHGSRGEKFQLKISNSLVHAYYWAWFDTSTNEDITVCADFTARQYRKGIEKLLAQGECSIRHGNSSMTLRSKPMGVHLELADQIETIETTLPVRAEQFSYPNP